MLRLSVPLLLLIALPLQAEDWPTFHRDAARTGVSAEPWDKTTLQVAWSVQVDEESVDGSPAVVGDCVYVGTARGDVVCLNAADGAIVWRAQTGGAVVSAPAVAEGKVFAGSADRCLYAFDAADGKRLWRVRTRGPVVAPPLCLDGKVVCGSMDGTLRCVRAVDGAEVWRSQEQGPVSAGAAAAGGAVYCGDEAGGVVARSLADGKQLWALKVQGGVVAAPSVSGNRLLVPVMSPTALSPPKIRCVLSLDPATGTQQWAVEAGSSVLHTPVADATHVYFATVSGYLSDTELVAHRLADGEQVWKRKLGGVADSSPVLAGTTLMFGNHDTNFYLVQASDGVVVQTLPLESKMFATPAIANGRVYIGLQGGKVVCLK